MTFIEILQRWTALHDNSNTVNHRGNDAFIKLNLKITGKSTVDNDTKDI